MDYRSPWTSCEIGYRVRRIQGAQDVGLHPAMPSGWTVSHFDPKTNLLVFEVFGEVSERDGVIVRSILEREGIL